MRLQHSHPPADQALVSWALPSMKGSVFPQADKLCAMTLDGVAELNLPSWLPLSDAATLIDQHMATLPPGASCRPLTVHPDPQDLFR